MVVSIVRMLLFGKKGVQSEWCSLKNFDDNFENIQEKIPVSFRIFFLIRYRHPPNKAHPNTYEKEDLFISCKTLKYRNIQQHENQDFISGCLFR
jgi:hypothetical protein